MIISAGAFNTPQLLKLSGIGPSAELKSFNIPVVTDLSGVGTNLQDRYESGVTSKTDTDFAATSKCTFNRPGTSDPCLAQWQANPNDRGVYGSDGFAAAIVKKSAVSIGDILITSSSADQWHVEATTQGIQTMQSQTPNTGPGPSSKHTPATVPEPSPSSRQIQVICQKSTSTTLTLELPPMVANTRDLDAAVEGLQIARKFAADLPPVFSVNFTVFPGTAVATQDQMRDYVKDNVWGHHASCACPIGADNDPMAVLDRNFNVRGVDGLRVVDASVFPRIPGIFIAVPVYMISEKAADVILATAK